MELNEVQDTYFTFQDKRTIYLQEIEVFFLERKLNPYLWLDEKNRLHIKIKLKRGSIATEDLLNNIGIAFDELKEKELLEEVWTTITTEINPKLPEEIQAQTSFETIFKSIYEEE